MGIYYAYDSPGIDRPGLESEVITSEPATESVSETRAAVKEWLATSLPPGWPACGQGRWIEDWRRAFYAAGWAAPTWPSHLGGLGLSEAEGRVVNEELAAVGALVPYNLVTVRMIGATLMEHASPEQLRRLLPDLARGRAVWCQLFSEPGSGSDLASLSCRAVRDGSAWVVQGQKLWTSFAAVASWGLLLARTDPALPKRGGITAFAVPMVSPGLTVRPLRQMTGDADFCEVFLDDVTIDDNNRIGEVNDGWRVARSALSSERGSLGGEGTSPVARVGGIDIEQLLAATVIRDRVHRDQVVQAWIRDTVVALLSKRLGADESAAPVVKIAQAVNNQALQNLATNLIGPSVVANDGTGLPATVGWGFLRCRANTIGGGTSEILRTIIGEQILGLPREPDPYARAPWRDIPRS
jgi:alkylation response protein AidB-like acyl-CoA dehydrogenase